MKKIFILNGSRRKKGNTNKLITYIINKLENFEVETTHPQDFFIKPCQGCNQCFIKVNCCLSDDLNILQEKMLTADVLILASPVYLHYMTGELKMIIDRCSWWAHTLRLQGKPVIILSTCQTNGHKKVIEPLSDYVTFMGGNVVATANAALIPNEIENSTWLDEVSTEIANRIQNYASLPPQSNLFIEKVFSSMQLTMKENEEFCKEHYNIEHGELKYWQETGMLAFDSFSSYLEDKHKGESIKYENALSTAE